MAIELIQIGKMEYSRSDSVAAAHAFTTRHGGVSKGIYDSLNFGMHREDPPENVIENHRIMAAALGYDPEKLVLTRQTHSDIIRVVTKADHLGFDHGLYPECDGLITNDPGTALMVFTADCTPILLHDRITGAVGAVHAGWRGTAQNIAVKAVGKMQEQFGSKPENITALIGPNIGFCCFETDSDVPQAMETLLGDVSAYVRKEHGKYYVNLKEINAQLLYRAGVKCVEQSGDCTMCSPNRYWSHRYTRGIRGAQGAIIVCEGSSL